MRTSILLWSTASGLILGIFLDATLIGVALLLGTLFPGVSARMHHRALTITAALLLCAVPFVMGVLGFLEGRLKTI
jgi:hypothetical protein